ncbi:hypothetical protein SDJN02_08764, partial [Cucurbita argyrosperma subsp. argyrosperma]
MPRIPSFFANPFLSLSFLDSLRPLVSALMPSAYSAAHASQSTQLCLGNRRRTSFRKRCLLMIKQQKTRFYILARCISMLMCWNDRDIPD